MEQHLCVVPVLVLVLVLVSLCEAWVAPEFCRQKPCPEYEVVSASNDQGFEERRYVDIDLVTTTVAGQSIPALTEAVSRLEDYCGSQKDAGYEINCDTWPGLLTVTEGESDHALTYSWFIPPGANKTDSTDPSVRLETRPSATVYVKVFGGPPSIGSGQGNAELLRAALREAGKTFDQHTFTGAGYDPYFSLTHHNEVWIYAA